MMRTLRKVLLAAIFFSVLPVFSLSAQSAISAPPPADADKGTAWYEWLFADDCEPWAYSPPAQQFVQKPAQTRSVPFIRTGASVVVDVAVGGKTRHFLLDTGAGMTVLSPDTAGWSLIEVAKTFSKRSAVGVDGATHSMGSTTAVLKFAQTTVVTPVAIADLAGLSKALHIKLDGILGQDVLSQFSRITIDYKNKLLILEK